jgi:hypothetical protein
MSGCETSDTNSRLQRIQEKSMAYAVLPPRQQQDIKEGAIEVGYTDDMVYMALGKPGKIVTSADGAKVMWVYYKYYATATAAQVTLNSTNARNNGHRTAANTPYAGAANGPGAPASFSGTGGPVGQSMELPDLASDTLYVFLREGKVVEIQLESQTPST